MIIAEFLKKLTNKVSARFPALLHQSSYSPASHNIYYVSGTTANTRKLNINNIGQWPYTRLIHFQGMVEELPVHGNTPVNPKMFLLYERK